MLLLGPRQVGKSALIRHQIKDAQLFQLLLPDTYNQLSRDPQSLIKLIDPNKSVIVIDEIQKVPELLDVVHYLIEEQGKRFLLTGSSARKLKKNHVNLLGGRARGRQLFPLIADEYGDDFSLARFVESGSLPTHYLSDDLESDLATYIGTYLQTEIANEGLTRSIPAFSRFLDVAGLCHGEQINFAKMSSDTAVPRTTLHGYFQILLDTLIVTELPSWQESQKRKPVATSKFYFFDWGVARKLQKIGQIAEGSPLYGKAFESFIFQELIARQSYKKIGYPLCYWRSTDQYEVDFIFNNEIAIEVKSKKIITERDLKNLRALREEKKLKRFVIVYTGTEKMIFSGTPSIEVLPWKDFLDELK